MSENTQKEAVSGHGLSKTAIAKMLTANFEKLPELDQKVFTYGPVYLAANGALAGLVANSLYRKALHVKQAAITSGMPMAVLPFITTFALYNASVSVPLMSGDLNCPTCALVRGGLVGVVGGGVYPILLALPLNMGLASRYSTAPMPEKGAVLRHWVDLSRPILRRMRAVVVIQAFFGTYLASRDFETYSKLAKITFSPDSVELKD